MVWAHCGCTPPPTHSGCKCRAASTWAPQPTTRYSPDSDPGSLGVASAYAVYSWSSRRPGLGGVTGPGIYLKISTSPLKFVLPDPPGSAALSAAGGALGRDLLGCHLGKAGMAH